MKESFYGNGKLLISGEYAILDGALGWAWPTRYGQRLQVTENTSGLLSWDSLDHREQPWFQATYALDTFTTVSSTDPATATALEGILAAIRQIAPSFLRESAGVAVAALLGFPRDWGLGSSSTLISTLAEWARIDPYTLLAKTFGGSGYDIACARHDHPICFRLSTDGPTVTKTASTIPFRASLYFVFLNQKRNSREAIAAFRRRKADTGLAAEVSAITEAMVRATTLSDFSALMQRHELLLSKALGLPPVQRRLFPDYDAGTVKSLGAWGGDFVLATGDETCRDYFNKKGYHTVIPFSQMIL